MSSLPSRRLTTRSGHASPSLGARATPGTTPSTSRPAPRGTGTVETIRSASAPNGQACTRVNGSPLSSASRSRSSSA